MAQVPVVQIHTSDPAKVTVWVEHGAVPGMQFAHGISHINGKSRGRDRRDDRGWLESCLFRTHEILPNSRMGAFSPDQ